MTRQPVERRPVLRTAMVVATLWGVGVPALDAETLPKKSQHRSQPPRPSQTAPDRTGTIPKPQQAEPSPASGDAQNDTIPEPYTLPDVPRARMRACGEVWRAKKMAGDTGDQDWRDFAMTCLVTETIPDRK